MNQPEFIFNPPRNAWLDRAQAFFEVLLMSGLASSFLAALPFSLGGKGGADLLKDFRVLIGTLLTEATISFILLALILKAHRRTFRSLGLRWEEWKGDVLFGVGIVPVLFLVNVFVMGALRIFMPSYVFERNPLMDIIHSPLQLGLFVFAALIAGGIKEELQRAFIITSFHEHLGGARLGLVLWSVAFGAGHYVQGLAGMLVAGILGFIFGAVYLLRGNIIAPMVAHGLYNTLSLLGYWFVAPSAGPS
jgi:membrane protease YdiL (CAAX protease family)